VRHLFDHAVGVTQGKFMGKENRGVSSWRTTKKSLYFKEPLNLAGGKGVEPLFTESESVVLPLNDPPFISSEFGVLKINLNAIISLRDLLINREEFLTSTSPQDLAGGFLPAT
jgi:hypothetical protein